MEQETVILQCSDHSDIMTQRLMAKIYSSMKNKMELMFQRGVLVMKRQGEHGQDSNDKRLAKNPLSFQCKIPKCNIYDYL